MAGKTVENMNVRIIAIIIAIIAGDQAIKHLIVSTMETGQTIPVIQDVFHITFVQNFGAAFSILQNQQTFLVSITGVVMAGLFFMLMKYASTFSWILSTCLALIIGGGIGNFLDRAFQGFVVDYLDFRLIQFPVFNLADISIVCGATILILYVIFMKKPETE